MQSKRASESAYETILRQTKDNVRKAQKRALETEGETWQRRQQDMLRTAKKRASETESETLQRQMLDQEYTVKKRALESHEVATQRKANNKAAMAKKRASVITTDKAIDTFLSKAKLGPDFVCVCCNRMMYKQTVVPYNKAKYTKASNEQVVRVENSYISSDG